MAASLLALSSLLDLLVSKDQHDNPTGTENAVHAMRSSCCQLFGLSTPNEVFMTTLSSTTGGQMFAHGDDVLGGDGGGGLIAVLHQCCICLKSRAW